MISSRKLLRLARKWRMVAAIGRTRISFPRTNSKKGLGDSKEAPVAKKGHFVLYTTNGRGFEIPLSYLGSGVIRELFAMAEEELGIPRDGPIVLPVDPLSMEDVISLIRRGLTSDQEKALLSSLTQCRHATADKACPQIYVCS